jgi:tetratricopeptide (TPR) repeat protein
MACDECRDFEELGITAVRASAIIRAVGPDWKRRLDQTRLRIGTNRACLCELPDLEVGYLLHTDTWENCVSAAGEDVTTFRINEPPNRMYEHIAAGHRVELHRLIAERQEQAYGERVAELAAELAYHYGLCGDQPKYLRFLELAGQQAVYRRAYHEAEQYYRDALAILETRLKSPDRDGRELTLQLALGEIMLATRGFSATATAEAYARARLLAERKGEAESLKVFFGLWNTASSRGELQAALALADQLVAIAGDGGGLSAHVTAHFAQGLTHFMLGHLREARRHFLQAIERYREEDFRDILDDLGASTLGFAGVNE